MLFVSPSRFTIIKLSYEGEVIWNARIGVGSMAAHWHWSQNLFAVDPTDNSVYISYMLGGAPTGEYVSYGC